MAGSKGGLSEAIRQKLAALRKENIAKILRPVTPCEKQLPAQAAKNDSAR